MHEVSLKIIWVTSSSIHTLTILKRLVSLTTLKTELKTQGILISKRPRVLMRSPI
jgi:hypothetical protein